MRILSLSLAAAAALVAMSGSARAAVVSYTLTGALSSGHDTTGIFGPAGQSLAGVGFIANYLRDDATPGATQYYDQFQSEITGYGASSPVHATLTINGVTRSFGETNGTQVQYRYPCEPGCSNESFGLLADTLTGEYLPDPRFFRTRFNILQFGGQGFSFLPSADYHSLPSLEEGDGGVALVGQFIVYSSIFDNDLQQNVFEESADATFYGGSLRVTSISSAPEPGAWALMVLGFGGVGAALRRRSQALAA